jgi:ABC-type antimicrobial peptide transport system permease subunit
MEERLGDVVAPIRQRAMVYGVFASIAVTLAMGGLYGLLSYSVEQRLPELALRLALGATRWHLLALTLWNGLRATVVGGVIGLAAAAAANRIVMHSIVGTVQASWLVYAVTGGALLLLSCLASYLPARRASCSDPLRVLKA